MVYGIVINVAQAVSLFLLATIVFDGLHYLMHVCLRSRYAWLRKIGMLHLPHHRFFSVKLKINPDQVRQNLYLHVMLENGVQLLVILLGLFYFHPIAVVLAASFQMFLFVLVMRWRGEDPHHQSYDKLPADRGGFFVSATYHALHHRYADRYYSSYVKVIDMLFGTAHHLAHKNIVMTGANGALGSAMKQLLEAEQAQVTAFKYGQDYDYHNYDKLIPALRHADILFLCHGSKVDHAQEANCDSYVKIIELYKKVRAPSVIPPEIWATGSEIECHPCFGIKKIKIYAASKRNYAKHAHNYYHDKTIQYRHFVHSSFMSAMGPGLMSAMFAARVTMFFIKRGFRYIPVSYTGFGVVNYLRFAFRF